MIKQIPQAVSVKKAILLHDDSSRIYTLIHYDTEIMKFNEDLEIMQVLQCSKSSSKAIMQVADYFDIDKDKIRSLMIPYRDFYKYPVGN